MRQKGQLGAVCFVMSTFVRMGQPKLTTDGVAIAMLWYVLQNDDAWTRSGFNALRRLSLLQIAETSRMSN